MFYKFATLSTFLHVSLVLADTSTKLKSYSLDAKETSVSGISSGGFFATQMQVSFSSIIKGAGVIASGSYNCGAEHLVAYCMALAWPYTYSIERTKDWSGDRIDPIKNLKDQKVYMISGSKDTTVSTSVTDLLYDYYKHFIDEKNIVYNKQLDITHTFSTDFDAEGNAGCDVSASPYISNCGFDSAGAILKHIYGDIGNRTSKPTGDWLMFDQTEFAPDGKTKSIGLDDTGFLYVPKHCQKKHKNAKDQCRLHVAFHGCGQNHELIQDKFLHHTGYDQWADQNRLIIMMPQTHTDHSLHWTSMNGWLNNPAGCWDWLGWYDSHFQSKSGLQTSTIKRMIDRITSEAAH